MSKQKERNHKSLSQEWYTFKVLGKEVNRIKVKAEDIDPVTKRCQGCKSSGINSFHVLGCLDELIDCPKCGLVNVDFCNHDSEVEDDK